MDDSIPVVDNIVTMKYPMMVFYWVCVFQEVMVCLFLLAGGKPAKFHGRICCTCQ